MAGAAQEETMKRTILICGVIVLVLACGSQVADQPVRASAPGAVPPPALERWPDKDPGPPFALTVSANRVGPASTYLVSGLVRNDGDQTYEAISVIATFFSEDGFRYGPVDTRCPCTLLAPGESCPFIVQAAMRSPVAFVLHPEGRPTGRESTPVALSQVRLAADGLDSVRITGVATNEMPFKIENPIVTAVLVDGGGQMVSLGYTYVLLTDIAPGARVPFDLRVSGASYTSYRMYAQAERDWR
jgi:hypothetical protein